MVYLVSSARGTEGIILLNFCVADGEQRGVAFSADDLCPIGFTFSTRMLIFVDVGLSGTNGAVLGHG